MPILIDDSAIIPASMFVLSLNGRMVASRDRPELQVGASTYATRDGRAEALAELSRGGPARLNTHIWNGRASGFQTPGLKRCDPRYAVADAALFRPPPEADWQEPYPFSPGFEAAVQFAQAYNLAMYMKRGAQIKRACPKVDIDR